jgi:hypothetical protein
MTKSQVHPCVGSWLVMRKKQEFKASGRESQVLVTLSITPFAQMEWYFLFLLASFSINLFLCLSSSFLLPLLSQVHYQVSIKGTTIEVDGTYFNANFTLTGKRYLIDYKTGDEELIGGTSVAQVGSTILTEVSFLFLFLLCFFSSCSSSSRSLLLPSLLVFLLLFSSFFLLLFFVLLVPLL